MRSSSPVMTFNSLLLFSGSLFLPQAFSQCEGTWEVKLGALDSKVFEFCEDRIGPVRLVWKTKGNLGDDEYFIALRKVGLNYYPYEAGQFRGEASGYSDLEEYTGGTFYPMFRCNLEFWDGGGCDDGDFEWKIIDCGCSENEVKIADCEYERGVEEAKDAVCVEHKPFVFMYELRDFEFEPVDVTGIKTEKISTSHNGNIKNCAFGATADHNVDMSLSKENSQSMTVSKSFTSSHIHSVAAGVSVTVEASASAIFASASVATTASFQYESSWESSRTQEEIKMLQTTDEIEFTLGTTVSVQPNTCILYTLSADVSAEPIEVPYKANTYLTVLRNEESREKVTDQETLETVQELLTEYNATIDLLTGTIVYPIEGVYKGLYASKSVTETSNCNDCGDIGQGLVPDGAQEKGNEKEEVGGKVNGEEKLNGEEQELAEVRNEAAKADVIQQSNDSSALSHIAALAIVYVIVMSAMLS